VWRIFADRDRPIELVSAFSRRPRREDLAAQKLPRRAAELSDRDAECLADREVLLADREDQELFHFLGWREVAR
jgi:hypothetical protein